jgi:hypothetical protein
MTVEQQSRDWLHMNTQFIPFNALIDDDNSSSAMSSAGSDQPRASGPIISGGPKPKWFGK